MFKKTPGWAETGSFKTTKLSRRRASALSPIREGRPAFVMARAPQGPPGRRLQLSDFNSAIERKNAQAARRIVNLGAPLAFQTDDAGKALAGKLQAVVFDWAGTTVDFGCQGPVQAFREGFSRFGIWVEEEEVRAFMGMGKIDHARALCALPRIGAAWADKYGAPLLEKDVRAIYRQVEKCMLPAILHHSIIIPGVEEAVETMRAWGLRIGSCTGYPRQLAELMAEQANSLGYAPDVLVCSSDVSQSRPAPDMCRETLIRLGVTEPKRAVKIGDTINDVLEGLSAGMWVIGVTLTGAMAGLSERELGALPVGEREALHQRIAREQLLAGAHYAARDVPSCLELLREIGNRD